MRSNLVPSRLFGQPLRSQHERKQNNRRGQAGERERYPVERLLCFGNWTSWNLCGAKERHLRRPATRRGSPRFAKTVIASILLIRFGFSPETCPSSARNLRLCCRRVSSTRECGRGGRLSGRASRSRGSSRASVRHS